MLMSMGLLKGDRGIQKVTFKVGLIAQQNCANSFADI